MSQPRNAPAAERMVDILTRIFEVQERRLAAEESLVKINRKRLAAEETLVALKRAKYGVPDSE